MGDSAVIQELVQTRAALSQAIAIGERLQARVDAALVIVRELAPSTVREQLVAALEGKR